MRPQRGGNMFGRGGYLNVHNAAAKLAIAVVVLSVVSWLTPLRVYLPLNPESVITAFALWQPFTFGFLETPSIGLIFVALIVWSMGGALEATWGSKRLLLFSVGTAAAAGILTVLLGLIVTPVYAWAYYGGTMVATNLWVAYGWSFGRAQTNFWGLPLSGNALAWIGVGFVALNAVAARSPVPVIPDVFGIVLTAAYIKLGSPRILVLKLRQWKYQRELRSRSKHLNVVSGGRNQGRGSDRFLH